MSIRELKPTKIGEKWKFLTKPSKSPIAMEIYVGFGRPPTKYNVRWNGTIKQLKNLIANAVKKFKKTSKYKKARIGANYLLEVYYADNDTKIAQQFLSKVLND